MSDPKPAYADTVRATIAARHRRGDWHIPEILTIAAKTDFIVHKYRYSHEALRAVWFGRASW